MRVERAPWVALVLLAGMASACGGGDEDSPGGPAALPAPRANHALVSLGGRLYAIGGQAAATLARVDRYDPTSNTWTRRADMHSARREFAAGALDGKIYVACGMSWSDPNEVTYVTTTEEYDPVADTWTERAPCPMDPAFNSVYTNVHVAGATANGRLYVMVFNTQTPGLAATYEYDPGANAWTDKAAPPYTQAHYSVAEAGGFLYLLASDRSEGATQTSWLARYDPVGDAWTSRQSLTGVIGSTLAGFGGAIFAVGGVAWTGSSWVAVTDVNRFDPGTNAWSAATPLGAPRYLAGAAAFDTALFVTGGSSSGSEYDTVPLGAVELVSPPDP